jgi:hypothetical protein
MVPNRPQCVGLWRAFPEGKRQDVVDILYALDHPPAPGNRLVELIMQQDLLAFTRDRRSLQGDIEDLMLIKEIPYLHY